MRFLSRIFLRKNEELLHGLEIVAQYFGAKPEEVAKAFNLANRKAERRFYTLDNMLEVFHCFARDRKEETSLLKDFAKMLAFDALVGAGDRHGLNWGVVRNITDARAMMRFAPLYDTARGLFWDHPDARLESIRRKGEAESYLQRYANRSNPVFGTDGAKLTNHFGLVEYALQNHPTQIGDTMRRFIKGVQLRRLTFDVERRFRRVISPTRLWFIGRIMAIRITELQRIVDKHER